MKHARVLVVAVLAFALGCGDDCVQPPRDAPLVDARTPDASRDAPAIDAPALDAPAADAPMPDAALGDASCLDGGSLQPSYSRSFGESYFDTPYGVALDNAGNAIITGGFYNTIDFGGGPLVDPVGSADDIFVAKLDTAGNHVWSLSAGGANSFDQGHVVAVDGQGNVYVAGETGSGADFGGGPVTTSGNDNFFLAKLTSAGAHVWSHGFVVSHPTGAYEVSEVLGLAIDNAGHVVITGHFQGTVDFGAGPLTSSGTSLTDHDVFVAMFDSNGNTVWSARYGGPLDDEATGAAFDLAGNLFIAGHFNSSIDFGLGPLASAGDDDVFIVKFYSNSLGLPVWNRRFGGMYVQRTAALAVNTNGAVALVGDFGGQLDFGGGPLIGTPGNSDVFIAKLDDLGNYVFARSFGDANEQRATGVAFTPTGNVIMTGYFLGTIDFGPCPLVGDASIYRLYAAEFDGAGNTVTAFPLAGSGNVIPTAIRATTAGVVLTGTFQGSFDAGLGPLTSVGQTDIFLLRYGTL
jgi:hypothetical protein